MTDLIRLNRISRTYHRGESTVGALREVSVTIARGEFVAIMGPSGSGKSTMLNLIGLLDRPTSGSYQFGDQEVSGFDDDARSSLRGRRIGFIFQSFNLFPMLDVLGNVEVPMIYAGVRAQDRQTRAKEMIELVGLTPRLRHRPGELSGGEMQRVAIARALTNDPELILADEPTGNLDSATAEEISKMLDDLHRKGRTIILVTHNPELGKRAERVIRLRDGRVE